MTPEQAIEQALQQDGASVLEVMAQAAELLQAQPEALAQVVAAAVKANPQLATQIVSTVVQIAPAQKAAIVQAATAQITDPAIQSAITLAADQAAEPQVVTTTDSGNQPVETEAEQTEVPAGDTAVVVPTPPPPPTVTPPSPPTSVSPS